MRKPITVWFTTAELEQIGRDAAELGLPRSTFVRRVALAAHSRGRQPPTLTSQDGDTIPLERAPTYLVCKPFRLNGTDYQTLEPFPTEDVTRDKLNSLQRHGLIAVEGSERIAALMRVQNANDTKEKQDG